MMRNGKWIVAVLASAALALSSAAKTKATLNTVKVKIEATEMDRALLLDKLNEHAKGHHLQFESVGKGWAYRIVFATGQGKTSLGLYGEANSSQATVAVYDAKGNELFQFQRKGRTTDAGATNAAAKEIIKRLLQLRKLEKERKP